MQLCKQKFIEFILNKQVLKFGKFILNSGRKSPYLFNIGILNTGHDLLDLGYFYAKTLINHNVNFNVLFGPAYKGIPIVISTAIALAKYYKINVSYSFNRKERKNHADIGDLVGSPLHGKVMLIDDVITVGNTIRKSIEIVKSSGAILTGILVSLDRQERNQGEVSSLREIEKKYNCQTFSIITLNDLISYMHATANMKDNLSLILKYQKEFGIKVR